MTGTWRAGGALVAIAAAALLTTAWHSSDRPPYGFADATGVTQREFERRFLTLPSADFIRDAHRHLTDQPHPAGSQRDRELAEWTLDQFRRAGLADAEITTHEVLLPWPQEVTVEMTAPRAWHASMREEPVAADPHTQPAHADPGIPYHAYSASGEVTAAVVFAGDGHPADYDWLQAQGIDVRGKIVLVRYSVPYSYRGFKALTAQTRGAAGILMFTDPGLDGGVKGETYPDGRGGPESRIERGGIAYDFLVPGDPLTPGWASTPGARRVATHDAVSLPRILSAPLSFKDARVILDALAGPEVPATWRPARDAVRRAGAGPAVVRLKVQTDDRIRPVWTVTATIRGSEQPDDVVIVGNHRDAWVYGGVDPGSGSAALVELARTLGHLQRAGWRPRRTILLASWDAEEFAMTTSTEWGEQHQDWLREHAVAYLNVDSAASGPNLSVSAVPALNQLLDDVARTVKDPNTRLPVGATTRDRLSRDRGHVEGTPEDVVDNRLGSGSDYTVFLNFLGVPVADISFEGPYGVYHSVYDTHNWVARFGDPGFRYHLALVQFVGLAAMRLAGADVVPLDYEPYAKRIEDFAADAERLWMQRPAGGAAIKTMAPVRQAAGDLRSAAARFNARRQAVLEDATGDGLVHLNRQLISVERAFIDPDGLPGRPWYRHLIYAPKFTYAPEMLPGIAEAVTAGDDRRAQQQAIRLTAALRRAAASLETSAK